MTQPTLTKPGDHILAKLNPTRAKPVNVPPPGAPGPGLRTAMNEPMDDPLLRSIQARFRIGRIGRVGGRSSRPGCPG